MNRRRFLAISAACLAAPAARASTWHGRALGADISITLRGPDNLAAATHATIRRELARIEQLFSLHDTASQLARLNHTGQLGNPAPEFTALCALCTRLHAATGGIFDPTVQPLWQALARDQNPDAARNLIGWHKVQATEGAITLAPGQQLTFNGIAQGFATDRVAGHLRAAGYTDTLVNIGEFRAIGGPWRLGIADPLHGLAATATLRNRAIATSSPAALRLGRETHILNPHGPAAPLWSTISVEAGSAALADSLSTAFCHMTKPQIRAALRRTPGAPIARLIAANGQLTTLA